MALTVGKNETFSVAASSFPIDVKDEGSCVEIFAQIKDPEWAEINPELTIMAYLIASARETS